MHFFGHVRQCEAEMITQRAFSAGMSHHMFRASLVLLAPSRLTPKRPLSESFNVGPLPGQALQGHADGQRAETGGRDHRHWRMLHFDQRQFDRLQQISDER